MAMMAAVQEARAAYPDLSPWRYFSKIEQPGKQKAVRSFMNPSLVEALAGWGRICKSEGFSNISALTGMDDKRRAADDLAAQELEKLSDGRWPSNKVALSALRLWGFDKNTSRENVLPEGEQWVHSDTLGIISDRRDHKLKISAASKGYQNFQRLLTLWLRGRLPPHRRKELLPYTTISVNKDYGAKLHRDRFNEGPSVGIAVGTFTGGGLRYYPDDPKIGDVELLHKQRSVVLDLKRKPAVFDGTCGHSVEPYKGERFSLIFFTVLKYNRAGAVERRTLRRAGSTWPSPNTLHHLRQWLPKRPAKAAGKAMKHADASRIKHIKVMKTMKTMKGRAR